MQKRQYANLSPPRSNFLGQQVSGGGISPIEAKIKAIRNWATPQNVKDVHSFLGFANYYQRFIHNFAKLQSPLTDLTKKGMPWQWGPHQQNAFKALKEAYCNAPMLLFLDSKLPYTVSTEASGVAGGSLVTGSRKWVAATRFCESTFHAHRTKILRHMKRELAAMAYCLQGWRHYLKGCLGGTTILTDHQTLIRLMDQPVLTRAQTCWM